MHFCCVAQFGVSSLTTAECEQIDKAPCFQRKASLFEVAVSRTSREALKDKDVIFELRLATTL